MQKIALNADEKKLKDLINGVTKRHARVNETLKESQRLIHAIFETTQDCIFVKDDKRRYIIVNPGMELIFQQPASELRGKTDECLFGDDVGEHTKKTDSCALSGKITREEHTQILKDVQTTLDIVKMPMRNNSGEINGIFGIARDLTEHKKTERLLKENEKLFSIITNSTGTMLFTLDKEQRYTRVSGRWIRELGLTPEQFIGKRINEVLGDDAIIHEISNEQALKGGKIVYEWPIKSPEGPKQYQTHISPTHDSAGKISGLIGFGLEITEYKKTEAKLLKSEKKLKRLAELVPEIVYEADKKGDITFANHTAIKTLGYMQKDFNEGFSIIQIIASEDQERFKEDMQRVLRYEIVEDRIYSIQRKNGSTFPAETYIEPIIEEGIPAGFRGIIVDITDKGKKQIEELMKLNKAKTEFISIAGHELRTPIQSMMLASDLLSDKGGLNKTSKKHLDIIKNNCLRLDKLINKLLDLSILHSGIALDIEDIEVISLLSDARYEMNLKANEKDIKIIVKANKHLPNALGDKIRLNQVITNLIGNAIKFTPEKGVITISSKKHKNEIIVCVEDTGPGIPKDMQHRLFDMFFRIHSMTNKKEGLGLGLAISKEIIKAHNGHMWCESEEGKGSKFGFTIPIFQRK